MLQLQLFMTSPSNPEPTKLSKSGLYDSDVRKKQFEGETGNKPLSHAATVIPLATKDAEGTTSVFVFCTTCFVLLKVNHVMCHAYGCYGNFLNGIHHLR